MGSSVVKHGLVYNSSLIPIEAQEIPLVFDRNAFCHSLCIEGGSWCQVLQELTAVCQVRHSTCLSVTTHLSCCTQQARWIDGTNQTSHFSEVSCSPLTKTVKCTLQKSPCQRYLTNQHARHLESWIQVCSSMSQSLSQTAVTCSSQQFSPAPEGRRSHVYNHPQSQADTVLCLRSWFHSCLYLASYHIAS